MFDRPHHNAIAQVLKALDAELLLRAGAWFGGGTAIVLKLGEYRESVDIDFLCSSKEGYRLLREATFGGSLDRVLAPGAGVTVLREVRSDQYGIRTQLEAARTRVKFEIVREARIDLSGEMDPRLGVPVLTRADMYCEKLLANADRYADKAVLSRDIIDLSMMISRWGPIPKIAWDKAEAAYGQTVRTAYDKAVEMISNPAWLRKCIEGMAIEETIGEEIIAVHGDFDAP